MTKGRSYKELFFVLIVIVTVGVLLSLFKSSNSHTQVTKASTPESKYQVDDVGPTIFDVELTESVTDSNDAGITSSKSAGTTSSKSVETTPPPTINTDSDIAGSDTNTENMSPPTTDAAKTHVLLLTEGRSGSTWLSSFFWFRKEVFYVFEPLYYTGALKAAGCHSSDEQRKHCDNEVLRNLWGCTFRGSKLSVLGRYPHYRQDCNNHNCELPSLEKDCQNSSHIVAKTILLFDLENIADIMNSADYNVKVIHLVRDPRPLAQSRMKGGFGSLDGLHKHPSGGYTDSRLQEEVATLCARMLRTSKLGDNPPEWLKGRYMRISHEDMSLKPVETAESIFNFVGLSWDDHSKEYVYNTTVGAIGKGGMFGIKKISREIIEKWKTSMLPERIQIVTDTCKDTLLYLGYETDLIKLFGEDSNEDS